MKAIVWSREHCPYCVSALRLLESKGIEYEVKKIGEGYSREDLLAVVPEAKTVPQIFLNEEHVGGYAELRKKLEG
jgi:glutaredoxin 3